MQDIRTYRLPEVPKEVVDDITKKILVNDPGAVTSKILSSPKTQESKHDIYKIFKSSPGPTLMSEQFDKVAIGRINAQKKLNMFGDADGDKVPNFLDCKPFNKKQQGWFHDLKTKLLGTGKDVGRELGVTQQYTTIPAEEEKIRQQLIAEENRRRTTPAYKYQSGGQRVKDIRARQRERAIRRKIAVARVRQTPAQKFGITGEGLGFMSAMPGRTEGNGLRRMTEIPGGEKNGISAMSKIGVGGGFGEMIGGRATGSGFAEMLGGGGAKADLLLGSTRRKKDIRELI